MITSAPLTLSSSRARHLLFAGGLVSLAMLNLATLRSVVDLSSQDATASHLVLVPFVSLALIFQKRQAIFGDLRWCDAATAGATLGAASMAAVLCLYWRTVVPADALSASVAVIVVAGIGMFRLVYGPAAFRAALFPLLFGAFMVPIPAAVVSGTTLFLKDRSADCVSGLFALTGTPFHRQGFVFELPRFAIEIANECSGIRSSIALMLTSLLAGYLFLETGWRRALLAAAVIPLAVLKNGIRIVLLSLLATYVDGRFISGALHHEGGIVFFLLTLLLVSPLFIMLCNSERPLSRTHP